MTLSAQRQSDTSNVFAKRSGRMLIHDYEVDGPRKHRIVEFPKPAPGIAYGEIAPENGDIYVRAFAPGALRARAEEQS